MRDGDSAAARKIWEKYHSQLVRLARQKLHAARRRVADEEDVVVDAFDSFYRGVCKGRFPKLDDRDDLWQVLVVITERKALNQWNRDRRQKRGGGMVRGDSVFAGHTKVPAGLDDIADYAPTPEFAALASEEYRRLLNLLEDETLRTVAIAKMEGFTNGEIAAKLGVQSRTVERKLRSIREIWTLEDPPEK